MNGSCSCSQENKLCAKITFEYLFTVFKALAGVLFLWRKGILGKGVKGCMESVVFLSSQWKDAEEKDLGEQRYAKVFLVTITEPL